MLKNEKLFDYILNILMISLFFILVFIVFFDDEKNGTKKEENEEWNVAIISEEVYNVQEVDGLKFSSSPIVENETGGYRIEVNVTNMSEDVVRLSGFTLVIYDESHNKIDTLSYFGYKKFEKEESMLYMIRCEKGLLKENYSIEYIPSYVVNG